MAVALVGDVRVWDEIQQNFDLRLSRIPDFGHLIVDNLYGVIVYGPTGNLVVYYHVNDEEEVIELLEVHRV
jgi:plasmid stabilization system protein ParE